MVQVGGGTGENPQKEAGRKETERGRQEGSVRMGRQGIGSGRQQVPGQGTHEGQNGELCKIDRQVVAMQRNL